MTDVVVVDRRLPRDATRSGSRMSAHAHLATEVDSGRHGVGLTRVSQLHSEAPLVLRPTRSKTPLHRIPLPWDMGGDGQVARVSLTAGAAGPVGGDDLALSIEVGAGSSLVLSEISPTLLLPGPHGERSRMTVRIRVGAGGTLVWLPEPVIAVKGCDHLNDVAVELEVGARLFMREEALLGRHCESWGQLHQRISVRLEGRALYRQDLGIGTPAAGTPAVLGSHRAVGSTLIVDPAWNEQRPQPHRLEGTAAVLPLEGPAALITAVGTDNLQLREHLAAGVAGLRTCASAAPANRAARDSRSAE